MAKTTIIISDKVRPDGKSRIYAYVSVTRTNRFRIKTPIFITRSFFNDKLGEVIIPRKDKADIDTIREAMRQSSELNAFISRLSGIMSAGNPSGEITKEWFEHVLALQDNENISLKKHDINRFDLERAFNEETRIIEEEQRQTERIKVADALLAYISNNDFSEYRNKAISTVARVVNRFEMFKQLTADKNFELYADSMTPEDAEELREYMSHESQLSEDYPRLFAKIFKIYPLASNPKKPRTLHERGDNYITHQIKAIKATFNWLRKKDITTNDPFKRMNVGCCVYGAPIYITTDERNLIADFDMSKASATLQEQRDIFVFQCLVGCRVGDLKTLSEDNISAIGGRYILEYIPSKTSKNANQVKPRVPLSERAISLVKKYKGVDRHGRLFPFISDQNYNEAIKEIFTFCGITRTVIVRNPTTGKSEPKPINEIASSHMARRTFVGAAYKVVKDPNLIGAMSGHVPGSDAFNRYRAIDVDDLSQVIGMIG